MKKIFLSIILFCLLSVIFIPVLTKAADDPACMGTDGKYGLVRCGCSAPTIDQSTKKCTNCCEIGDFFGILARIYDFLVMKVATVLATLAIIIGAIIMIISAGNPNLANLGKKIIFAAIIGMVLAFCSYLIIDFILNTLGYNRGAWNTLPS